MIVVNSLWLSSYVCVFFCVFFREAVRFSFKVPQRAAEGRLGKLRLLLLHLCANNVVGKGS